MYEEASEQRKMTAPWYSSACAIRPMGIKLAKPRDKTFGLAVIHAARRDGVDANAAVGPVGGQITGQADQPRLDDRVRNRLYRLLVVGHFFAAIQPLVGGDHGEVRGDVQNDPPLPPRHFTAQHAAAHEGPRQAHGEVRFPHCQGEVFQSRPGDRRQILPSSGYWRRC